MHVLCVYVPKTHQLEPLGSPPHRPSLGCLAPRLLLPLGQLVVALPEERVLLARGAPRPLGVREARAARELAHRAALARDVGHALLQAAARSGDFLALFLLVGLHVLQVGGEHLAQQRELLLLRRVAEGAHALAAALVHVGQFGDDLEGVALVDEELLPLGRVEDLLRVAGDERVEEGIEVGHLARAHLGPQDAPETLGLLATRAEVRRDLDDHVGVGQVDRGVAHLGDEDGVVLGACLELLEHAQPLRLRGGPVDERPAELDRVLLEREDVVGEDDHLVAARLVEAHEVLARAELVRVHRVEQPLHHRLLAQVL
mmetsp:Transcript_8973/g.22243  ORF Transcript_8973/g.22243 Transcript_8973/m.22243 type:complete len:315 (+) Transcript_8973:112-1056(+)